VIYILSRQREALHRQTRYILPPYVIRWPNDSSRSSGHCSLIDWLISWPSRTQSWPYSPVARPLLTESPASKSSVLPKSECRFSKLPDALRSKISRKYFRSIWAFEATDFFPHLVNTFMQDVFIHHFITRRGGDMSGILSDHSALGAHTNIVHLCEGKIMTYIWSHPVNRPFGKTSPMQCTCGTLRPWTVKTYQPSRVVLQCKYCKRLQSHDQPEELQLLIQGGKGQGDWFIRQG
jgi:hypothetical protein